MLVTIKNFDFDEDNDYDHLNFIYLELLIDSKKEYVVGTINTNEWSLNWGFNNFLYRNNEIEKGEDISDGDTLSLVLNKLGESLKSELGIDIVDPYDVNKNEVIGFSINYFPNI